MGGVWILAFESEQPYFPQGVSMVRAHHTLSIGLEGTGISLAVGAMELNTKVLH